MESSLRVAALPPPSTPVRKRPALIRLGPVLDEQARELAALRGEPLATVLTALLVQVVPQALAHERARGDRDVGEGDVLPDKEGNAAGGG